MNQTDRLLKVKCLASVILLFLSEVQDFSVRPEGKRA